MRQGLRPPSWAEVWPLVRAEPLAFRCPRLTLRRASGSPVLRLVSHLLIRLLILSAFPPQYQAWAALFPVSMLWSVVGQKDAAAPAAGAAAVSCSERGWGVSGEEQEPRSEGSRARAGGLTEARTALRSTATKVGMEPREAREGDGSAVFARHGSFTCTAPADAWPEWSARGRTVVVDARLLPLAAPKLLDASGGELQAGLVIRAPAVPPAGAGTALAVTVEAPPPLSAAQVIARRYAAVRV